MRFEVLRVFLISLATLGAACRPPAPPPPPPPDPVPGLSTGVALRFGRAGADYAIGLAPVSGGIFLAASVAAEPSDKAGWPSPFATLIEPSGKQRDVPAFSGSPISTDGALGLAVARTQAGDVLLARRIAEGGLVWEKSFSGPGNALATAVAADATGAVAVTGTFDPSIDLGGGTLSGGGGFLGTFTTDGVYRWSRSVGQAVPFALVFDGQGNVVVTGRFGETVDLGGGLLTSQSCGDAGPCFNRSDAFVASYSAQDGGHRWSRQLGGPFSDLGTSLVLQPDGGIVVAGVLGGAPKPCEGGGGVGTCTQPASLLVAQLDPADGTVRWEKHFPSGTPVDDLSPGLAAARDGTLILTGGFTGLLEFSGIAPLKSAGSHDLFVARLGADGAPLGAGRFGGSGRESGRHVTVQPDGGLYVAGEFQGAVDFGGVILESAAGSLDVFLLRLDP